MFVNFAKKQSDNLEQQEAPPPGGGPAPLQRLVSMLKSRQVTTELSALVSEAPEELESDDDEGLISFEEERVRASQQVPQASTPEPPAGLLGTHKCGAFRKHVSGFSSAPDTSKADLTGADPSRHDSVCSGPNTLGSTGSREPSCWLGNLPVGLGHCLKPLLLAAAGEG